MDQVGNETCKSLIQEQIDELDIEPTTTTIQPTSTSLPPSTIAMAQTLELKYDINILSNTEDYTSSTTEAVDDGEYSFFSIIPLTPEDLTNFIGEDVTSEDIETIADIFDEELEYILSKYDSDMTQNELNEFCPELNEIYMNIANVQRRLLINTIPSYITFQNNPYQLLCIIIIYIFRW